MILADLTASEAAFAIARGETRAENLARAILDRITDRAALNAFSSLHAEAVLAEARDADLRQEEGAPLGLLHGVPISFKDNINVVGHATTAGTPGLRDFYPAADAPVVQRLRKAGAVVLGKVGMHELAYGVTSVNPAFGTPQNPVAQGRVAGGSSGGSGAAVGGGLGPLSIGTDTGGSVRIPAAFCGTWGYRPSVGRWPGAGIVPISSSRDTPGPLARSAADLALVDRVVTGHTSPPMSLKGLRIGWSEVHFWGDCDPEIARLCCAGLDRARAFGAEIVAVDASALVAPHAASGMAVPVHEGQLGLAAFLADQELKLTLDDIADLLCSPDVQTLFARQRDPARRITAEAYVRAATETRPALIAAMAEIFVTNGIDLLASPTVLCPPPRLGETGPLRLGRRSVPLFDAIIHNVDLLSNAGCAGVAVPMGLTPEGLPAGLSLDAPHGGDALVLGVAQTFN